MDTINRPEGLLCTRYKKMTPQSIISHYNQLNGKPATIEKLRKMHGDIEKYLDNNGSGPYTKTLSEIRKRLAMGLKKMAAAGADSVDSVQVNKIEVKGAKKVGKKKGVRSKKKALGKPDTNKVEPKDILHGLECNPIEAQESGLGFTKDGQAKIYKMITEKILATMKKDGLFWRKKWDAGKAYVARSYPAQKAYNGINWFILTMMANLNFGYSSPYFMTYKAIKKAGGNVRRKAEKWPVVFYTMIFKHNDKRILEQQFENLTKEEKQKATIFPVIQYYSVFNGQDVEGVDLPKTKAEESILAKSEPEAIESAERIVEGMQNRPDIDHGNRTAHFVPSSDKIDMPHKKAFDNAQDYYSVLFHELVHSTGHKSRLNREMTGDEDSKEYIFEELIAELGASYLCAEAGILYHTLNDSAVYLKHYSGLLKEYLEDDNKFFLKAAAQAQKAVDYILGKSAAKEKAKTTTREPVKKSTESDKAKELGKKAFRIGKNSTPAHDPELMKLIKDKKVGKESTKIMEAWSKGYHAENIKEASPKKTETFSGLGSTSSDQMPDTPADTFQLSGEVGKLLGKLQAYKLEIIISGETHSGKSELAKQVANAFIKAGHDVAYVDWEHGGLQSKDTQDGIRRNIEAGSKNKLLVNGEVPRTLEAVKDLAKHFKVIVLDSGTKIKEQPTNAWVDELRESHPNTIWVVTMQQTVKGGTRGGSSAEFDAPIVIKTYRDDINDYRKNYAVVEKNRGNSTGTRYNIASKKIEKQLAKEAA